MCKFIGKSNERVLCKLSKKEILRLYSIVHVAMETTKTSNFNRLSKSFISIFFTCQVSACELQPFSCYDLANDIYLQTAKAVFSHLKQTHHTRLACGVIFSRLRLLIIPNGSFPNCPELPRLPPSLILDTKNISILKNARKTHEKFCPYPHNLKGEVFVTRQRSLA